jgi:hypothetical protein
MTTRFSEREGLGPTPKPITAHDAPREIREALIVVAEMCGVRPKLMRELACQAVRRLPNAQNWSDYPNVWDEACGIVLECEWYRVYDVAEAIFAALIDGESLDGKPERGHRFEREMNAAFLEHGVGWAMERGRMRRRGDEVFESSVAAAQTALRSRSFPKAAEELAEALRDLSRRPDPDRTEAIQHAMAALECVAKELSGDRAATLGAILKAHGARIGIAPPLDSALDKLWGFSSDRARHVREGHDVTLQDAELTVRLVAAVVTYLDAQVARSDAANR